MHTDLSNLNRRFDHAALKPEITEKDIVALCDEAREYDFYAVAVNPVWVSLAKDKLESSRTGIVSVAGFPLGADRSDIKIAQAVKGVGDGATEIDMVANIGWLASREYKKAESEISLIRNNLPYNIILKVIVEAGKLTDAQLSDAARVVVAGGAQFVKTSTGFFGGATVAQVLRLYQAADGQIEVKASGGIRTLKQCREFLKAGASRLGSSSSVEIMRELKAESNG